MAQEGMFWERVPEDVLEKLALEHEWRGKKRKTEKATGRQWKEFDFSARSVHLREYALRKFWEIVVDDKPFCRSGGFKHANVHSKAVFSAL